MLTNFGIRHAHAAAKIAGARTELAGAEKLSGQPREQALRKLASQLKGDVSGAADKEKVQMLADAVSELATAHMTPASLTVSR